MTVRSVRTLLAFLACSLIASSAFAQATRTWVSGVGDDANPCSRTAPCKTFAGAYPKTATGGEISVLDPGGYGAVTINKSLTINGVGENAGILASLVNGIIINAPGIVVHLKHLQINGAGNGLVGVRLRQDSQLIIEDSVISGFQYGIHIDAGRATVSRSAILSSQFVGAGASAGTLSVERSLISGNGMGVQATGAATIRLSNNNILDNTTSFACGGGVVVSAGNNTVAGGAAGCPPAGGLVLQ